MTRDTEKLPLEEKQTNSDANKKQAEKRQGGPLVHVRLAQYGCPHLLTRTAVLSFGKF